MPVRDPQAVLQKWGQTPLKVDTYFLQRTGFVANQTILKLGEYNLNCVPATLGIDESRFLAVLTPVEINHFGRFKAETHILILTFDDPENNDIARFHLRVTLVDLVPVPDRKNVCFLLLKFKSVPAEFALFLGNFLEALEARREAWQALPAETVEFPAGFERSGMLERQGESVTLNLKAIHTKRLFLEWPAGTTPAAQDAARLRLTVRRQPLLLEGSVDAEGAFVPEFHTEWLAFLEDLRFHKSLKGRSAGKLP